jgi:hypothetical protein
MKDKITLVVLSFFSCVSENLPDQFHIAGLGLFEFCTVGFSIYYFINNEFPKSVNYRYFKTVILPILAIVISFYIADIFGLIVFSNYSLADYIEPLRLLLYVLFVLLISRVCKSMNDIYLSIFSCIVGIFFVALRSYLKPGDESFLYGLPVLNDPNVVANLIGYAFIGIALLANSKFRRIGIPLSLVFTFLQFLSFSKAGWMMMIFGWFLILISYRVSLKYIFLILFIINLAFIHYDVYIILKDALDLKLNAAVGAENEVGSFKGRQGFLLSSIMTFRDYPLGIGNHYFAQVHYQHAAALGSFYSESTSPHSAIGYLLISSGFIGISAFLFLVSRAVKVLGKISGRRGLALFTIKFFIGIMLLLSCFFQIELLSQPFLYLVLGYCYFFINHDKIILNNQTLETAV